MTSRAAKACAAPVAAAAALASQPATAQIVSLNYDRLSSFEEPLAFELDDVTIQLTGMVDVPVAIDLDGDPAVDNFDPGVIGNFQVTAQTLLPNRWRLGAAYFGQYASDPNRIFDNRDDYSDNVAGFVGTSVGTVLGGNVSGQVREQTRRRRAVGNGFLAFDNFYGGLDEWGGAYVGRFGPSVFSAAVDDDGNAELGYFFQRPLGQRDYRFALRLADGRFTPADRTTEFSTKGVMAVGEVVYAKSLVDLGIGYERLESPLADANRWFVSSGMQTQVGALRLSAEAHLGKAAGERERSLAFGAEYFVGRGLSANLGINFEDAQVFAGPVNLVSADTVQGLASIRFSF